MKKGSFISAFIAAVAILSAVTSTAQTRISGSAEFDRMVYDFGDISIADGPVSCKYTVTNIGKESLNILSVASSCGCTDVRWTREAITPGAKGTIEATYKNEDGPIPFDKTLTVYLSGTKQPVILRLRGVVHDKKLPLSELYPVKRGDFAMKSNDIPRINLNQGQQKSGEVPVANTGKAPVMVEFTDVSQGLKVSVTPNPIPAGSTAHLTYTVTADRERWGINTYDATPVIDGRKREPLHFHAATKEDFSALTKEQRAAGANPKFDDSIYTFNPTKAGKKIDAVFTLTNIGKSTFHVHKIDADNEALDAGSIPDIAPGGKAAFKCTLDTSGFPEGEVRVMITLTTNSPLRPVINLFITGFIK